MSIFIFGKGQRRETGKGPIGILPGRDDRAGFKSILFDPEGSVLSWRKATAFRRGMRTEEEFSSSPFFRLLDALLENYVKLEEQQVLIPIAECFTARIIFARNNHSVRRNRSYSVCANFLPARNSVSIGTISRYAPYNGSLWRQGKLFFQRMRIHSADA